MNARPSIPQSSSPPQPITFDAILPAEMAVRAEDDGVARASKDILTLLILSVLAGAFIAFGAAFATTVSAGSMVITLPDGGHVSVGLP